MQSCVSYSSGGHIFGKSWKKVVEKWKMMPKELRWQVWWVYEGAWWGLKSKMLVFHWFYHYFLKCEEGHEYGSPRKNQASRGGFEVRKWDFWLNMLCVYIQKCVSHCSEEHIFTKGMKTCHRKMKNVKISPQWGRMHQDVIKIVSDTSLKLSKEATCSNNTHICEVFWGAA